MPLTDREIWTPIFIAGTYNFGDEAKPNEVEITAEELQGIASRYDTSFHEADLHIGHPDFSVEPEPAALGWIAKLKVEGDNLLCSWNHISADAKKFVNDKMFKFCSVEFGMVKDVGRYLIGLGLTNYPRVTALPELSFAGHSRNKDFYNTENFSNNKKINSMPADNKISEGVLTFAQRVGINVSDFLTDSEVLDNAAGIIEGLKVQFTANPEIVTSLSLYVEKYKAMPEKITALETEVETLKTSNAEAALKAEVETIIADGIANFKILPSQKAALLTFGLASKDSLKTFIEQSPKLDIFKSNQVAGWNIVITETDKFKHENGKPVTFADYAKAKKSSKPEDAELCARFNDDEVKKLPGYDKL